MKKDFLFFLFLFLTTLGFSQTIKIAVPAGASSDRVEIIDGVTIHNYSAKSNIPINGTPYLIESFQPGYLELPDGVKSDEVLLRYNIAKDLFEILRNEDTLTLNRPYAVKYINMGDKLFVFDPKFREDADRSQNGYFQLRVEGKLSLYIKMRKDLSFDSFVENYQGGSGTKEYYYVDKINFIGKTTDGKPFLINSQKSFLSHLEDHKSEMKSYIKEHHIKFKDEDDLVKLVEYYNSL